MNSEERFKKSLEDLLASKEFSFDEANWDKAKQMIDASKRQRRLAPFALAAILLIGSLLTGYYFLSDAPSTPDKKVAHAGNKEMKSPEVSSTPELRSQPQPELNIQAKKTNPATVVEKPLSQVSPVKEQVATKTINTRENTDVTSPVAPSSEKTVPQKIKHTTPASLAASPVVASPANTPIEQTIAVPETKTKELSPENPAALAPPVNSDKNEKLPEPPGKNTTSPSEPVVSNSTHKEPSGTPTEKTKSADEHFAGDVTQPLNNSASPIFPETKTADLPLSSAPLETTTPLALIDSSKNNPSKEILPPDNYQGELGKPKEQLTLFSIEAGVNYMFGWQNPGTRDAKGFNPVVGINYFNNFKSKMSLSAGLQYSSVANLSYGNYTSKVMRYGFGEESRVSVFTPVKVHYLIVPLRFNYSINSKNTVGIGCNIAYLLNVEGKLETYTEKLNTKTDEQITKTSGYLEGFKKFNTQLSVFYKRTLYRNLAVNFELLYGLTDVKDNRFFNSNVVERNSGIKLTLVYNIFKK